MRRRRHSFPPVSPAQLRWRRPQSTRRRGWLRGRARRPTCPPPTCSRPPRSRRRPSSSTRHRPSILSRCPPVFIGRLVTDCSFVVRVLCRANFHFHIMSGFTARCYASAVLAMALCLSVCPSQVGVLLKRLHVGSHKQPDTIVQGL